MAWSSLLIVMMFLILCKCSLTYRNHFRKNFSEIVILFLAVSRWRWCVYALISWGRNQRIHTPSPQIQILIVVSDYIYRYLWSYQHNGDVSPESYVAWASIFTSLGLAVCYITYIVLPPSSLLRVLRKWCLKITGGKFGKWHVLHCVRTFPNSKLYTTRQFC